MHFSDRKVELHWVAPGEMSIIEDELTHLFVLCLFSGLCDVFMKQHCKTTGLKVCRTEKMEDSVVDIYKSHLV